MAAFFFFINAGLTISEKKQKKQNYFEIKNYIKYKQDI